MLAVEEVVKHYNHVVCDVKRTNFNLHTLTKDLTSKMSVSLLKMFAVLVINFLREKQAMHDFSRPVPNVMILLYNSM